MIKLIRSTDIIAKQSQSRVLDRQERLIEMINEARRCTMIDSSFYNGTDFSRFMKKSISHDSIEGKPFYMFSEYL